MSASSVTLSKSVVIAVCESISVNDPKCSSVSGATKVAVELRFSVPSNVTLVALIIGELLAVSSVAFIWLPSCKVRVLSTVSSVPVEPLALPSVMPPSLVRLPTVDGLVMFHWLVSSSVNELFRPLTLPCSEDFSASDKDDTVLPASMLPFSVVLLASTVAALSSLIAVGPVNVLSVNVMGFSITVFLSTCSAAASSEVTSALLTISPELLL